MTEIEPGQIEVWTVVYGSSDHRNVGAGCSVHFTEHDAVEALRATVLDHKMNEMDNAAYDDDTAYDAAVLKETDRIAALTTRELDRAGIRGPERRHALVRRGPQARRHRTNTRSHRPARHREVSGGNLMDRDEALAAATAVERGEAPSGSVVIAVTGPNSLHSTPPPTPVDGGTAEDVKAVQDFMSERGVDLDDLLTWMHVLNMEDDLRCPPEAAYDSLTNFDLHERDDDMYSWQNQRDTVYDALVEKGLWVGDHDARPDDDPEPGDRCKDCGKPITWMGPSPTDWEHAVCVYCRESPADPGYDRCTPCRTWRDEEWCEANNHPHGEPDNNDDDEDENI